MKSHALICHPRTPSAAVKGVRADMGVTADEQIRLRFVVVGSGRLVLPPRVQPSRASGLWQSTCFELFVNRPGDHAYCELNFSPSLQWAACAFKAYRSGMREMPMARPPRIDTAMSGDGFQLDACVEVAGFRGAELSAALCAVIEEQDGTKSYWALDHWAAEPDFHDPAGFVACIARMP